jgi:hypothetical protein
MSRQLKVSVILESLAQTQGFQRFNQELRACEIASKKLQPTLNFIATTTKTVAAVGTSAAAIFAKSAQASIAYASNITDLANAANVSSDALVALFNASCHSFWLATRASLACSSATRVVNKRGLGYTARSRVRNDRHERKMDTGNVCTCGMLETTTDLGAMTGSATATAAATT